MLEKPVTAVQDCVPPFVGVKPLDSFVTVLEFLISIHHKYGKNWTLESDTEGIKMFDFYSTMNILMFVHFVLRTTASTLINFW